jgi:dUTP pyrophosphatase
MKIKFKNLRPDQRPLPSKANPYAAGIDIRAVEHAWLMPREMSGGGAAVAVKTGWAVEIPDGYEIQVRSRSGLAKKGIVVANSPGTIDSDYRGELIVLLVNTGMTPYEILPGDRIAQLVVSRVLDVEIEEVQELSETARGSNGFGSTGIK